MKKSWPEVPVIRVVAVEKDITFAEAAARLGTLPAPDYVLATNDEIGPATAACLGLRDAAAHVFAAANDAGRAAHVAMDPTTQTFAHDYANTCYLASTAADICGVGPEIRAAMWADYDLLFAMSRERVWTDSSPVDVTLLGPL